MPNDSNTGQKWIFRAGLLIPVIWLALKLAPCTEDGLLGVIQWFPEEMADPLRIRWCADSLKSILVCIGLYLGGLFIYEGTRPNLREGEEHGSAKWGDPAQLNAALNQKKSFPLTQHVSIGMDTHQHRRNLNILVIGGSGAGKTRSVVLPGVLEGIRAECSMIITDPKSEILNATGKVLEKHGYIVRVLNLIDFDQSDGYNPFEYIRTDQDVLKLITNLIRNTTPNKSSTSDPFWEKSEIALLEALMFYLLYEGRPSEQNFGMVMKMLSYAEIKEENDNYVSPLDKLFLDLKQRNPDHIAVRQYDIFRMSAGGAMY